MNIVVDVTQADAEITKNLAKSSKNILVKLF